MESIGYKLVHQINGVLYSYNANSRKETSLVYKPNEWTKPVLTETTLFYFDSIENAISYESCQYSRSHDNNRFELWRCEVINGRPGQPMEILGASIQEFIDYHTQGIGLKQYIYGSMVADAIKLLERVSHV